ncbi:hypothetical protein FGG08_002416 [Glutinoglossum americanum]|uniref:DSC E3 ubiquitin ligase complex subunit 3 ubiquitin-like domain-containing protein n=1 Tax=Glutinoglossum americanum TaxID=1670608 RepID=A0A9P8I9B9_9PEZI|nr:hypothetical protein FGG08_002416 [Glutinoglossum americanum]
MPSDDALSEQASSGEDSTTSPSPRVPSISISILSPSTELPRPLSFPCVPTTSTVGDLKRRIRDAVPSRPELKRLRLIHRGRMLSRDTDTMSDVFGPTEVGDSSAKSLHLVLRPLVEDSATSGPPTSSLGRQLLTPSLSGPSPTQHGRAGVSTPTEQLDHHSHEHNRATQRIAHAMRHGQMNNLPAPPLPPRNSLYSGEPEGAPTGQPASGFARHVAHQQQLRATAGMAGLQPGTIPVTGNPSGLNGHGAPQAYPTVPENPPNGQNPFMPGAGGGFTRTYAGPGGHRWHTTVNYSSVTIPNFGHTTSGASPPMPQNTGPGTVPGMPGIQDLPDLSAFIAAAAGGATGGIPIQHGFPGFSGQPSAAIQMSLNPAARSHSTQGTNRLELNLARVNQLRDQIHALRLSLSNRLGSSLSQGSNASSLGEQLRSSNLDQTATVRIPSPGSNGQGNTHTTRTAPNMNTPIYLSHQPNVLRTEPQALGTNSTPTISVEFHQSPDPVAYMLSSPSGPQALVISPHGLYSSEILHNRNTHRVVEHIHDIQQSAEPHRRDPERHHGAAQVPHQNDQRRPNLRARAAENGIPFAGLLQALAPLGANIWLIARLIGFVVLFTGNSSWQRTILLALGAVTVFLIQVGILGPVIEWIWGPVRRHVESVLLSADRRRAPEGTANARNTDTTGSQVDNARSEEHQQRLDPANPGAPLVRGRQQGQHTRVFETIRAIERAIIIFIASLVPGVGERHIAEIDAVQQIERIANERRAEAEAQEQIAAHGAEDLGTDSTNQRQADETEADPVQDLRDRDGTANRPQDAT